MTENTESCEACWSYLEGFYDQFYFKRESSTAFGALLAQQDDLKAAAEAQKVAAECLQAHLNHGVPTSGTPLSQFYFCLHLLLLSVWLRVRTESVSPEAQNAGRFMMEVSEKAGRREDEGYLCGLLQELQGDLCFVMGDLAGARRHYNQADSEYARYPSFELLQLADDPWFNGLFLQFVTIWKDRTDIPDAHRFVEDFRWRMFGKLGAARSGGA